MGNADRSVVGVGYAQEFGLAAGDPSVELRVPEQGCAAAVFVDLGGFTLRLQPGVAHGAVPVGDVERNHDAVADRDLGDSGSDAFDETHWLVAEDVSRRHERGHQFLQVQVGTAQGRRRDSDDRIGGLDDDGVRDHVDADVAAAVPHCRAHVSGRSRTS